MSKRSKMIKKYKKREKWTSPNCVDCGVNTISIKESYMVIDSVWKESGMKKAGGKLCVGCIEKRLDRKLTCRDFFVIGLNLDAFMYPYRGSKRLRKRLRAIA